MIVCGIYCLLNIANEKRYIGQSVDIFQRKQSHFSLLRRGKHYNAHLQRAFNAAGEAAFLFQVLEHVEPDMLDLREAAWISKYNSRMAGYNFESGGNANKTLSEATKAKMAEAATGRVMSQESRIKMRLAKLGKKRGPHSEETKRKIRATNKATWNRRKG